MGSVEGCGMVRQATDNNKMLCGKGAIGMLDN